ncbi:DMT family transporter [Granulosicoccus sp. 3-233]|uniref:DMT family transporter n=1 Tax=Granulosicoccus sp. 3-233 TaxID=3417969 RepID=UPI003D32891F
MNWIFLSAAICAEVIGTSALKASDGFTRPIPAIICAVAFGIAFYFLSLTLKVMPIGIVYAIWSGAGIVLISLMGYFIFGQTLDLPAMVGVGLIILGVVVINTLSGSTTH